MKPVGPVCDPTGGVALNYDAQTALSRMERARTTWPISDTGLAHGGCGGLTFRDTMRARGAHIVSGGAELKMTDLELCHDLAVGRELTLIALERAIERLQGRREAHSAPAIPEKYHEPC
jgi:hypothetical protein